MLHHIEVIELIEPHPMMYGGCGLKFKICKYYINDETSIDLYEPFNYGRLMEHVRHDNIIMFIYENLSTIFNDLNLNKTTNIISDCLENEDYNYLKTLDIDNNFILASYKNGNYKQFNLTNCPYSDDYLSKRELFITLCKQKYMDIDFSVYCEIFDNLKSEKID